MGRNGEGDEVVDSRDWTPEEHVGFPPAPPVEDGKGGRGWMEGTLFARRTGGRGLVGFFSLPSEERERGGFPSG